VSDQTREPWDREAVTFDERPDHGLRDPTVRRAWQDLLLPLLGEPPRTVADLGCGTGTLTLLLARAGHQVHGVDFSAGMLAVARSKADAQTKADGKRLPAAFTLADAAAPPLAATVFDVVICRHVLWALADPSAALEAWTRLLNPTGQLLLIEGRWSSGAGLTADACSRLVLEHRREAEVRRLTDAVLWGGAVKDERYVLISRS
jgi:ubiquinone/menaquinone biosynthesis C-methylase UbiE